MVFSVFQLFFISFLEMSEASVNCRLKFGCRNIRKKGKYGPLWFQETAFERCWKITFHVLNNC